MSGSGGSIGGGSGFPSSGSDCNSLVIVTQISSPQEEVVRALKENDILEVGLQPGEGKTAVVVLHNGKVAGGIIHGSVGKLRECLESGVQFEARVMVKDEGQVRVRIKAK